MRQTASGSLSWLVTKFGKQRLQNLRNITQRKIQKKKK